LREDAVTSVNQTSYSILVADFLNQIIVEVGQSHNWSADETAVTAAVTVDTTDAIGLYDGATYVTGSTGLASPEAHPQVDLIGIPVITGSFAGETTTRIKYHVNQSQLTGHLSESANLSTESSNPTQFSYAKDATGWTVRFNPGVAGASTGTFTITAYFYDPHIELEVDGTADSTELRYSSQVLYLGTLLLALNERGEELGEPGNIAEKKYSDTLTDAKYNDQYPLYLTDRYEALPD
jgi:hypothetical protein